MSTFKTKLGSLFALLVVVAFAMPAAAQVKTRDHRKKKEDPPGNEPVKSRRGKPNHPGKGTAPAVVSDWGPKSGEVGTEIWITGEFDRKTKVMFGGRGVRAKVGTTKITFNVPRRSGDGSIVLRHPDMGSDLVVGTFDVQTPPVIVSFSPRQGVPGTRVELRGKGFREGDQVSIAGKPARVLSQENRRFVIEIPAGATTDYIVMTRGSMSARTRHTFVVQQPAPTISGFSPGGGPAGTRVRISGANFTGRDRVFYGRFPIEVIASGPGWLDVEVPARARGDQTFTVRNEYGQVTSSEAFRLTQPPIIARFSPLFGVVGQRVEIYGDNFQPGDRVLLGGRKLKILQLRDTQISVEIPAGATSGPFTLERNSTRIVSADSFEVVYAPTVTGFSPPGGEPGTSVTITGTHFTPDVDVRFGAQTLRVTSRTDSALVVTIPARAKDSRFTVRTKGGEAHSAGVFRVFEYATVRAVSPRKGPAGSSITLIGRGFDPTDRFFLAGRELAIVEVHPAKVIVQLPPNAVSGEISWESHGRRFDSRITFEVLSAPVVSGISPVMGPAGSRVTIVGDHFRPSTRVYWGEGRGLKVIGRKLPTELVVEIPRGARGSEFLYVEDAGARVKAPQPFQVTVPPELASFAPGAGKPGVEITITGSNYSNATEVLIGSSKAEIISRTGAATIVVRIPHGTRPGRYDVWVREGETSVKSRAKLQVLPYSQITGFTPNTGAAGTQVDIKGRNFDTNTKIYFGDVLCETIRYSRKGDLITVIIPDGAAGTNHLFADDYGHRAKSPGTFSVTGGGTKPPPRRGDPTPPPRRGR